MIEQQPLKITPLISISHSMFLCTHEEDGIYKYSSFGGKILTKIWDFCTVLVGLIETIVRGALGSVGLIFLTIIDYNPGKDSLTQKVIGDILCSGAAASFYSIISSSISLFLGDS